METIAAGAILRTPAIEGGAMGSAEIITSVEVRKVIDRATNRLAYILEHWRKIAERNEALNLQGNTLYLRAALSDIVDGVSCTLSDVFCDLRNLDERLYPEDGESWSGYDLSGEISTIKSRLNLVFNGGFEGKDFAEKATEKAIVGSFEIMQDIFNQLEEMSGAVRENNVVGSGEV